MKLILRSGRPEDLQNIENWDWLDENIYEWKLKNDEIFLVEIDCEIVGYLRLEYLWSKYPYIGLIKVHEDYRRQGIGRSLLAFLEDHLRLNEHDTIFSSSQVNEAEPQQWHRRMGFVECGVINGINEGNIGEIFFKKYIKNIKD
ncbi:GNAT family N-acetyltransferase [Paenibacillus filicis]|uniref:GNAT family N-acetyltransferase n=1 Tax=Paenibacillus gyeongsangnamensis TaxID=3388067 RepID=A0ABT4QIM9_9BACL|nr:GNAT family N-acetyltransferase [Paenibacillus filicis]MCZ8516743.1 GNAT family N-acetyltransferase [Paenibacillus filicis]